jgi:hypothetical protein
MKKSIKKAFINSLKNLECINFRKAFRLKIKIMNKSSLTIHIHNSAEKIIVGEPTKKEPAN